MPGALILFSGARLSAVGLGVLLLCLVSVRGWNAARWAMVERGWPPPHERYARIAPATDSRALISAAVLALIPLCAFVPALLEQYVAWLRIGNRPALALLAVWLLNGLLCRAIQVFAFHRGHLLRWSVLWIGFAHGVAALSAWLGI